MFISKVILQDFQSHSYSEFNLDKGLNTIVGVSNVGKSSVSRALACVLFGTFDKSWVRSGCKFARIIIQTDTGIIVERQKGEKVNKYILTLPGSQPQTYENFGVDVPEAVQKALRIHEVQIDSKDSINLNLSTQLESLFLLSQPNSYKAKVFGKLSGAHILDAAIRELNRENRGYSVEKGIKEKELVELQGQVDKLSQIERFSTEVAEIESKLASVSLQESRLQLIAELLERVKAWKASWTQETAKEAILAKVEIGNIEQLVKKSTRLSSLNSLLSKFIDFRSISEKQNKLQALLLSFSLDSIPGLSKKAEHSKILRELSSKYTKNNADYNAASQNLQQVEKQHEKATKQYNSLLEQNGVCPICGTSMIKI